MKAMSALKISRAEKSAWSMNDMLMPAYSVIMVSEIDATRVAKLRGQLRLLNGEAPSYTAIVVKAASLVLKKNPIANRAILGLPFFKRLFQFQNVDVGIAVEKDLPFLPGLAYAPVLRDTAERPLNNLSQEIQFLKTCTEATYPPFATYKRILKWVPYPLSYFLINLPQYFPSLWVRYRGCAAWVNAPSKAGVDLVMTSWPWPMTFSFGIIKERPFVENGEVKVRLTMPVIMSFDRRIMGGGPASRIFADFQKILSEADTALGEVATSSEKHGDPHLFVAGKV